MKIIAPPTISNLKELADLLLNPAKYAKYLGELQKLLDAINSRLEDLDQFETISAYKAKADADVAVARQALTAVKADRAIALEAAEAILSRADDDAKRIVSAAHARVADERQALEDSVNNVAQVRSLELDLREQSLVARERDLEKRESELSAAVKQHESKVAKLKAAVA